MKKSLQINRVWIWVFIVTMILGILIETIPALVPSNRIQYEQGYVDYIDGWSDAEGNSASMDNLSGVSVLTKTLPDTLTNDDILFLCIKNANISISIGDEERYSSVCHNSFPYGKTPSGYYIHISLSPEDAGKTVTIISDNPYYDNNGHIRSIYVGNSDKIYHDVITGRLPGFVLSVLITFAGLVLIISFLALIKIKVADTEFLFLGFFALNIGIFMTTDCMFLQIFDPNTYILNFISEMHMTMIAPPLFMYIGKQYRKSYSLFATEALVCLGILNFFLCMLLNLFGLADLHQSVVITQGIYILSAIVLLYHIIKNIIRKRVRNILHYVGMVGLAIGAVLDVILLYTANLLDTTLFTRLGTLFLLIMESFQIITNLVKKFQDVARNKFLSKLAYQDGLTGLLNRTSWQEEIERTKKEIDCTILIASLDINNLKEINDKFGHAEGDKAIVAMGDILQNNFGRFAGCYRIGGDEFTLLSCADHVEESFRQAKEQMQADLDAYNQQNPLHYKLDIACGHIICQPSGIDSAIEEADRTMYRNKRRMKEQEKNGPYLS